MKQTLSIYLTNQSFLKVCIIFFGAIKWPLWVIKVPTENDMVNLIHGYNHSYNGNNKNGIIDLTD